MEEDIEHLKELKVELENMSITGPTSEDRLNTHRKSLAIENILNELERLQKENEYLKTHIIYPEIIKLNFIPKQAIRDKIKEIQNDFKERTQYNDIFYFNYSNEYAHIEEVLKKLLGE